MEGHESRVAFTVTDSEGKRTDAHGMLMDSCGCTVCDVAATNGRGIFCFTPQQASVHLRLFDNSGKKRDFKLPAFSPEGCTLSVDAVSSDSVTATIRSSVSMHGRLLGYVLMHGGNILECDTMTATDILQRSFLACGSSRGCKPVYSV